jgi:glycosyltransferase involved in cell wall biosynthesis
MRAPEVDTPLVTIGITCFNAADTITRAVQSALAQDWPNIEVLIVDDLSRDDSAAKVESAIKGDKRARLIRHERNTGPAGSRNTILSQAKGEFVVFFDDDDMSFPQRVGEQARTIQAYEQKTGAELVACYASGVRSYPNGYQMDINAIGSLGAVPPHGPEVADYLLFNRRRDEWFYGAGTPACALMARRAAFQAVGGFNASLRRVEDADFAIRLALAGGHFIGTSKRLYQQFSTTGADKRPEDNLRAEQRMVENHRAYLESLNRYYYALHWPLLRYWHFKKRYDKFVLEISKLFVRHPWTVTKHLLDTGPKRLWHEYKMKRTRREKRKIEN